MDPTLQDPALPRRIAEFVRLRLSGRMPPRDAQRLAAYLEGLARAGAPPPARGRGFNWAAIAAASGIDPAALADVRLTLVPGLQAWRRELRKPLPDRRPRRPPGRPRAPVPGQASGEGPHGILGEQPAADPAPWSDPAEFGDALALHMARHGDTIRGLVRWLRASGHLVARETLKAWLRSTKAPTHRDSFAALARLESRWRLPPGYFRGKLPHPNRATQGQRLEGIADAERRHLAWHLPNDFDTRPAHEREEILDWVRTRVARPATDYRRYHALARRTPYGLRFPGLQAVGPDARLAPPALTAEVADLIAFKSARFTPLGLERRGQWCAETARQKATHLGLFLGALSAPAAGPARGFGAPAEALTLGLLVFPRVWDWHLAWRERRRGFYTAWERDMLGFLGSLTAPGAGWLAQSPQLADRLVPLPGLVEAEDVRRACADWTRACAEAHRYVAIRKPEVERLVRVHQDSFEAIAPVLAAESPLGEYRKIAEEVLRRRPCPVRYPLAAAEAARAFLMIRLGLHLGFRQKNLRQLLVRPRGAPARSDRALTDAARGEMRWCDRRQGWEVFVPMTAFKNGRSSFFGGQAYRLVLPDVAGLYGHIDHYLADARPRLLRGARDPGVFFVKTVKRASDDAAYDQTGFYQAWRWIIERYGVFNPWTGRGAIAGLLPHGPHAVRDVLAAHVLKQTGSFEQASYAIQDTPETVARHYGRFLPQQKAERAAGLLNAAWMD